MVRKRDWFVCLAVVAYCLMVGLFTLRPELILADSIAAAPAPVEVTEPPVKFTQLADSPDPNAVFELINQTRVQNGAQALVSNGRLAKVAAERAADMAARQYYAHKNPDGQYYYDLFPSLDIQADYSCENLDIVFVPDINMFVEQWMASTKGHRNCVVNPSLKYAGYAVTKMTLLEYGGKLTPAYLVVAIHTTDL